MIMNPNLMSDLGKFTNTGMTPPMLGATATTGVGSGGPTFMERFRTMDPMKKQLIAALAANSLNGLANPKGLPMAGGGLSPQMLQMAMQGGPGQG